MENKVVLHFLDKRIMKGVTYNFSPGKEVFHLVDEDSRESIEISVSNLKAIYFVKTFQGNPREEKPEYIERAGVGKKMEITFRDGEKLKCYTTSFSRSTPGFFVFPANINSNNERIFVVNSAVDNVITIGGYK